MTGHKTRAVFDRYDIVTDTDLNEAARKLFAGTISASAPQSASEAILANGTDDKNLAGAGGGNRTHTGGNPTRF
jgi:hypothetical protein